jgi:uncharacterized membrane protein
MEKPLRIPQIDFIRGFAIVIMIIANTSPYIFEEITPPISLRLLFSLAAPTFIFLSGYNFYTFSLNKKTTYLYTKAIQVLVIGILIDVVIWKVLPFQGFDILYLISLCQIISISLIKSNQFLRYSLIFIFTIIVLYILANHDYRFDISSASIKFKDWTTFNIQSSIFRFVLDGWFPLIPWSILFLLGFVFASPSFKSNFVYNILHKIAPLFIVTPLVLYFFGATSPNEPREGYSEIFYPVTLEYSILILGVIIYLVSFIKYYTFIRFNILTLLGRYSLSIYLLHCTLIDLLFENYNVPFIGTASQLINLIVAGSLIILIVTVYAAAVEQLQKTQLFHSTYFNPIKFLIGL